MAVQTKMVLGFTGLKDGGRRYGDCAYGNNEYTKTVAAGIIIRAYLCDETLKTEIFMSIIYATSLVATELR